MSLPNAGKGESPPKSYFVRTYGCQMNARDSELVAAQLESAGLVAVDRPAEADLVFVNTCSVRDKAEQKLYSEMGRLRDWRSGSPDRRLVVGGCVAQQERERIRRRAPFVDLVVGTHQVRAVLDHLAAIDGSPERALAVDWRHGDPESRLGRPDPAIGGRPSVFVTIQEGCDNACTYCIVPFTRGREVSRPPEAVVAEVEAHVLRGAREVVLLGQNVNSYGLKHEGFPRFAELVARVHEVEGLERIRFTSPHPKDYDEALITAYRAFPKLCPSAHLPLQAGDDGVLTAMGRGYRRADFLATVDRLREARPGISFSTDIIVGFPGEDRAAFERTLETVETVRFSQIYAFVYSPRPGTPGARLEDPVPPAEKKAWLQELFDLQAEIQHDDHNRLAGCQLEVLWTEWQRGVLKGRAPGGQVVHQAGETGEVGAIATVKVRRATAHALCGTMPGESDAD